jgi:hypothetical protein
MNKGTDMPGVQLLNAVTTRDPEAVLTDHVPSEMLANEHDADQLVDRIGWALVDADQQINESHAHDGAAAEAAPARSVRRATARRAGNRRATARSRQRDTEASIIDFLAQHPGSTAGDLVLCQLLVGAGIGATWPEEDKWNQLDSDSER